MQRMLQKNAEIHVLELLKPQKCFVPNHGEGSGREIGKIYFYMPYFRHYNLVSVKVGSVAPKIDIENLVPRKTSA